MLILSLYFPLESMSWLGQWTARGMDLKETKPFQHGYLMLRKHCEQRVYLKVLSVAKSFHQHLCLNCGVFFFSSFSLDICLILRCWSKLSISGFGKLTKILFLFFSICRHCFESSSSSSRNISSREYYCLGLLFLFINVPMCVYIYIYTYINTYSAWSLSLFFCFYLHS